MRSPTLSVAIALAAAIVLKSETAFAHHVMGGQLPSTFWQGLLSGLAHPVIGLDHFLAVIAVGCLSALHRQGPWLVCVFVLAMISGVAIHLLGGSVAGAEILVASSILCLGAVLVLYPELGLWPSLMLFAATGILHGYVLGESIYGAEPSPITAYFAGLAVIQAAVALTALVVVRTLAESWKPRYAPLRLVGAGIVTFGIIAMMLQMAGEA